MWKSSIIKTSIVLGSDEIFIADCLRWINEKFVYRTMLNESLDLKVRWKNKLKQKPLLNQDEVIMRKIIHYIIYY